MAGQVRETGGVELVLGDLFETEAAALVVPAGANGSVAIDVDNRLRAMGIDLAAEPMRLGTVRLVAGGPKLLLVAAVVPDWDRSTPALIEEAARQIGALVPTAGSAIAFPLLGTGAGGLDPEDSARAIAAGFSSTAPEGSRAQIFVRDSHTLAALRNALPELSLGASLLNLFGDARTELPIQNQTQDIAGFDQSVQQEPARPIETVPTHTDSPAVVDELGRKGFARVLARRIRDARTEESRKASGSPDRRTRRGGAFLIHLHAPWGAGKTSLLNFLSAELRRDDPAAGERRCVVVDFNAWRHQRIDPPWWWLMTALYSGAVRELRQFDRRRAYLLRLREWYWRLKGGWPGYLALLLVAAILVVVWQTGWLGGVRGQKLFSLNAATGLIVTVAAIVTPALTIWGLLHGFGRWVFATSARGARRFIANTSDPMRLVQEHLGDLAAWIHHDVVIMIDDLDRCRAPYVVELLEGIQTLFRDVPVTYVVAADRDWLADSYATEYGDFAGSTAEPGRPVGFLFLEKTFQISTGLPRVGDQADGFWGRLLRSTAGPGEHELDTARAAATRELGRRGVTEARREVAARPGATPADVQARLETLAVEMVSERAQLQNTHVLEPFRTLLGRDPNPRLMKRLVNAYGIARGIETLQGINLADDRGREQQTALWTILCLRWPLLGAYLARYPERVALIGGEAERDVVPEDLRVLCTDPEVVAVVHGDAPGVTAALEDAALRSVVLA
ncbi:KAP-like P-loop domain-containing protein [Kribbella amoyensis]|uniref:KAP-like P-loop domain-containing protein n=1 Tax=Kribbella amoyensis TaxID=996641 RepID=A0A561BVB0_9ACTN|nr:P-loop NTPase fold protein [Kribbella amoyensis]TWD82787.1 KAP-like P-loop domain-containing protein [Kribbella amoyensis]